MKAKPNPSNPKTTAGTGHKSNVIPFPSALKAKSPLAAEFEGHVLLIEILVAGAKAKNERLIVAFEQAAKKNNCPESLALANFAKETDRHLSHALQGAALLKPVQDREGV